MKSSSQNRVVKLGDILPSLGSFDSVLGSLKSYRLWPLVLREALLDRAISGISCTEEEFELAWSNWCKRNEINPLEPIYEGLSLSEMRLAALREAKIGKFREQTFARLLPEYFRSRKGELDRVLLEAVHFQHESVAEEALFRCREEEQSLEVAANELAYRDGEEPIIKRIGPIGLGRLNNSLAALVIGSSEGEILGPKKLGHFYALVRVIEFKEASLDTRTRQRLLEELLNQWVEQQIAAMTGRAPKAISTEWEQS